MSCSEERHQLLGPRPPLPHPYAPGPMGWCTHTVDPNPWGDPWPWVCAQPLEAHEGAEVDRDGEAV